MLCKVLQSVAVDASPLPSPLPSYPFESNSDSNNIKCSFGSERYPLWDYPNYLPGHLRGLREHDNSVTTGTKHPCHLSLQCRGLLCSSVLGLPPNHRASHVATFMIFHGLYIVIIYIYILYYIVIHIYIYIFIYLYIYLFIYIYNFPPKKKNFSLEKTLVALLLRLSRRFRQRRVEPVLQSMWQVRSHSCGYSRKP